ncbi:MAG: hypothetical protein K5886_04480 [Lachnospiraceae bacterium]|nr:hypothetical protein [Lachnospiraceae bacterium]
MSKELEKLEKVAAIKCITDQEHIDRIIRYMLSLPFSCFKKDESRYRYLRFDLCSGFSLCEDDLDSISVSDVLILIGYEPGNSYFNPPDSKRIYRSKGRKFNAAGNSYVLALLIDSLAKSNIRIKEFKHIGLSSYIGYLKKKVDEEYKNKLLPLSACSDILRRIEGFSRKARDYVFTDPQPGIGSEGDITLGDLIYKALTVCAKSWMCSVKPLDMYCSEIIDSYDVLNRLFMDSLRMPLVPSDRERLQEIITKYRDREADDPVIIDYSICYEHGGIIKQ